MNILQMLKDSINTIYVKYINKDIEDIYELPIYYIGGSQTLPPPLEARRGRRSIKQAIYGR